MGVCVTVIQQRVHQNEFEHLYTNEWQALTLALAVLATVVAVSPLMVMGVATVVPCPDDALPGTPSPQPHPLCQDKRSRGPLFGDQIELQGRK